MPAPSYHPKWSTRPEPRNYSTRQWVEQRHPAFSRVGLPRRLPIVQAVIPPHETDGLEARVVQLQRDLADSRKHVASLEQQLAAVCGGLETEKAAHSKTWDGLKRERAAHMETKRCCDDAVLPLSRMIDERDQAQAQLEIERAAHAETQRGHGDLRREIGALENTRDAYLASINELRTEVERYRARYPEQPSIMDVVG